MGSVLGIDVGLSNATSSGSQGGLTGDFTVENGGKQLTIVLLVMGAALTFGLVAFFALRR
jgi:hypothetical protein